jgi:PAS domain S-box-containing protein
MNRIGLEMIQADSLDQVRGKCVYPLISEEYRAAFKSLTQDVFKGISGTLEFKMVGLKGRPLWLYTHAVPLCNEKGEIISSLAITIDITERKHAENTALTYRKRLEAIKELGALATSTLDLNALLQRILEGTLKTVGASVGMIFLKNKETGCLTWGNSIGLSEAFISEFRNRAIKPGEGLTGCIAESGAPIYIQSDSSNDPRIARSVIRKEGLNSFIGVPLYAGDEIIGVMNILTSPPDILSEQDVAIVGAIGAYVGSAIRNAQLYGQVKEAKQKILQSEEFIRNILNTVDEGFIVIDRDYRILTANRAYCQQAGKPSDEVIGRYCYEISHKAVRPCHEEGESCAVRHVFETGEPHVAVHRHQGAEGVIYVETKAFPVKDEYGAVASVIETVNNITEKQLLAEERLKTQKLEAIGTLAGGIAHDFNNLLQGVFGYISLAKLTADDKGKSISALEQAEKALQLSVKLTNQLLTFSRGGKPVKKPINLRPVIEDAAKFALSGSRSACRIIIEDGLWHALADKGQIGQVIQNIVLNADQSMPTGGLVEIKARNIQSPDRDLPQSLQKGRHVEISIKDNGIGMPEEYITRIFDPYFTTKQKGSGLGLATAYSIIKNHGGIIDVKSGIGRGASFFIYLPAVDAKEEEIVKTAPAETARSGRILVMDDEKVVREIALALIRALGHEVEVAAHGDEAVEKYRDSKQSGKPFDVVILDLTIRGGMGGAGTVRKLLEMDPSVKAVVSSGYSADDVVSKYRDYGFSAFLKKPYEVDELRHILNTLLK